MKNVPEKITLEFHDYIVKVEQLCLFSYQDFPGGMLMARAGVFSKMTGNEILVLKVSTSLSRMDYIHEVGRGAGEAERWIRSRMVDDLVRGVDKRQGEIDAFILAEKMERAYAHIPMPEEPRKRERM